MAIPGVDNGSISLHLNTSQNSASQTHALKLAEARAEARSGVNDGDETPGVGTNVNKLA